MVWGVADGPVGTNADIVDSHQPNNVVDHIDIARNACQRGKRPGIRTAEHAALLIASPEHNGGYTASLKNAIDWISRPRENGEPGVRLFASKVAALMSASPGPMGGLRSMLGMRGVLEKLGAVVIPQGFSLGSAHLAFEKDGTLADAKADAEVRTVGAGLVEVARRLRRS